MFNPVGLISLGGYIPAKKISKEYKDKILHFLDAETLINKHYLNSIDDEDKLPGTVETNYEGWIKQPWYDEWVKNLPPKKQENPFQGSKERRRVPMDPISIKESVIPHPMLPSDAETLAGALAIINAGIHKNDIDLVIAHSQVPDLPLPTNVSLIQHKLQLKNAGAYGMDTCCSSFVSMLEVASSLIMTGIKNNILIVCSYIDSYVNDKSNYYSVNTGDAAMGAIVSKVDDGYGYISSHSTSHGSRHDAVIFQRRSPFLFKKSSYGPNYEQEFVTFYNQMALKEIALEAKKDLSDVVIKALEKGNLKVEDLDFFVTHQPVSWAANAWREAIGVPPEKFYESFTKYGNIGTCSVPTNLLEALEKGLIKNGNYVMLASSGAGENHIAVLEKISQVLINNNRL